MNFFRKKCLCSEKTYYIYPIFYKDFAEKKYKSMELFLKLVRWFLPNRCLKCN
jgi:hypothetical protein